MTTRTVERDREFSTAQLSDLLERARAICPTLARESPRSEQNGALTEPALRALVEAGMFALWRPRSLGGQELAPQAYALVAEEVATADAASAFTMMAANNAAFDLRMANPSFVEAIYRDNPDALVCATFNRPLRADPAQGGVKVTGEAAFATGCRYADWIGHTALLYEGSKPARDGEGHPRMLLVYHPASALEIADDWHSLGLRGTCSNSVRAEGLFVPEARVVDLSAAHPPRGAYSGPLYRCPIALLATTLAPVALGALRMALASTTEIAQRKVPFAANTTLEKRALAQMHYGRALCTYRSARAYLHTELERAYDIASSKSGFDLRQKAGLSLCAAFAVQQSADAVHDLASAVSTASIYDGSPIQRALRDTQVLRHHAFASENRYATAAQAAWQLPIDLPLLAMD